MGDDVATVAAQIGRPVRGETTVVARCPLGLPTAIRVAPLLEDGTPFPTLYWLTCPLARRRVGRLEASGGVGEYADRTQADTEFADALAAAHAQYESERDSLLAADAYSPVPRGGVGGAMKDTGVKCLHAHYAHTLGGGSNPIGSETQSGVEPLDCVLPCVTEGRVNPEWREPAPRAD